MKKLIFVTLMTCAGFTHAQPASGAVASAAKKELVQKVLKLQQPSVENLARNLVEQPAGQLMQAAGRALQSQVPAEKREAAGKSIDADVKKYVDDAMPAVRERAIKLAPSTIGAVLEEKFTEDELKLLVAWLDSPVNKKFMQVGPEMQNSFMQKLVPEVRKMLEPKMVVLEQKIRTTLGVPTSAPASAPAKAGATAPARTASGSK